MSRDQQRVSATLLSGGVVLLPLMIFTFRYLNEYILPAKNDYEDGKTLRISAYYNLWILMSFREKIMVNLEQVQNCEQN